MKNKPKNTDNCQSIDFIFGSTSARYPQIKNSIYESAEIVIIENVTFKISFYASSYPF